MPLADHPENPTPAAAWTAVDRFVRQCRAYAAVEIERRKVDGRPVAEWEAYLRFTDHTLRELADGTLDSWFAPEGTPRA